MSEYPLSSLVDGMVIGDAGKALSDTFSIIFNASIPAVSRALVLERVFGPRAGSNGRSLEPNSSLISVLSTTGGCRAVKTSGLV